MIPRMHWLALALAALALIASAPGLVSAQNLSPSARVAQDAASGSDAAVVSPSARAATVLNAPAEAARAATEPALPEFDQAAIVRSQRQRLDRIKQELRLVMVASESDNFLLFSDLNTPVRHAILQWMEALRTDLADDLGIGLGERLWDGKCLVLVFSQQWHLAEFARRFDDHYVQRPRGYFVLEGRQADGPRLVHIASYQPLEGGNRRLREVLIHETTHAIVELYDRVAPLPLWVHEGLAEMMTVRADPELRPEKQAWAFRLAAADPYVSIAALFDSRFSAANVPAYSASMGLVECLHDITPGGVLRFVELMKEGVAPEAALASAYRGMDYAELERRWRRFVLLNYRPPVSQ